MKREVAEQDVYQTGGHYLFLYSFLSFMSIIRVQKKVKKKIFRACSLRRKCVTEFKLIEKHT